MTEFIPSFMLLKGEPIICKIFGKNITKTELVGLRSNLMNKSCAMPSKERKDIIKAINKLIN